MNNFLVEANMDLQARIDTLEAERDALGQRVVDLEAGRDDWKRVACFHLRNEQYFHEQRDNARAWSRLWKNEAKAYRLAYNYRLTLTEVWDKKLAQLQDERDELNKQVTTLENQIGVVVAINSTIYAENDELKARLLDALGAPPDGDYSAPEYIFGGGDPLHVSDITDV